MTTYSDLNTGYTPKNVKTTSTLDDLQVVKANLLRLFSTPIGSVPFNREYGSHLYEMLFDNDVNIHDIRVLLAQDIQKFEPRAQVSPMDIHLDKIDEHTYEVSCVFVVPSLNNQSSIVATSISDQN